MYHVNARDIVVMHARDIVVMYARDNVVMCARDVVNDVVIMEKKCANTTPDGYGSVHQACFFLVEPLSSHGQTDKTTRPIPAERQVQRPAAV